MRIILLQIQLFITLASIAQRPQNPSVTVLTAKDSLVITGLIKDFLKPGLQKLSFEDGSSGCTHYYKNELSYTLHHDEWKNPKTRKDNNGSMAAWNKTIDNKKVLQFLDRLNNVVQHPLNFTINDAGLTEADYRRYKEEIEKEEKNGSNIFYYYALPSAASYDSLLLYVDSISTVSPDELTKALTHPEVTFTSTSIWKMIKIINKADKEIVIHYKSDPDPNKYVPWSIRIDNYTFFTPRMEVTHFIEEVYPGFMNSCLRKRAFMTKVLWQLYGEGRNLRSWY